MFYGTLTFDTSEVQSKAFLRTLNRAPFDIICSSYCETSQSYSKIVHFLRLLIDYRFSLMVINTNYPNHRMRGLAINFQK